MTEFGMQCSMYNRQLSHLGIKNLGVQPVFHSIPINTFMSINTLESVQTGPREKVSELIQTRERSDSAQTRTAQSSRGWVFRQRTGVYTVKVIVFRQHLGEAVHNCFWVIAVRRESRIGCIGDEYPLMATLSVWLRACTKTDLHLEVFRLYDQEQVKEFTCGQNEQKLLGPV